MGFLLLYLCQVFGGNDRPRPWGPNDLSNERFTRRTY